MIRRLIHFYVFSNIHISLAAALFVLSSFAVFEKSINWPYVLFIASGTFIIYGLHRYIALSKIEVDDRSNRHLIFNNSRSLILVLSGIAMLIATSSYWFLPLYLKKTLLLPIIISIAYVIPSFQNKRLRDLPYLKILLIAVVWSLFYILPVLNSNSQTPFVFFEKFLFILGLTIPFDIRDQKVDAQTGLKTLGNSIKTQSALNLSFLLLFLSSLIVLFLYRSNIYQLSDALLIVFNNLIALGLISQCRGKSDIYFLALLDGIILTQGLFLILIN